MPEVKYLAVPAKEINSHSLEEYSINDLLTVLSLIKYQRLSQPSNWLFSYRAGRMTFYRNIPFLIKHSINHSSKRFKESTALYPSVTKVKIRR